MNSLYRTMFFVPGNDPKKIIGAEIYRPDCIIYDLEDSVSIFEINVSGLLVNILISVCGITKQITVPTAMIPTTISNVIR